MQYLEFDLDGDHIELNQLLKLAGIADSGGQGKAIVASGAVSVDGVQELRKTAKIRPGQLVQLDDVEIRVLAWNPDAEPDA
ncbi:RNA-binding S4 domain-containing protein [Xanthomonas euvesicatoria]|uniref:RNA-binding S4 domain-containing protein n=1 Tax=Xanthomonas euvesicatoria TaxID=456327 RepID=UPI003557A3D7